MSNSVAGRKRKWAEANKADPSAHLRGKIHNYVKELKKTARKAKGFEIQRLVKRMRDVRKSQDDTGRKVDVTELEIQMEILKKLDMERIVQLALASKIRKDKLLSSHELIAALLSSPPFSVVKKSTDPQIEKVEGKILSSPVLASETVAAINGLKNILHLQPSEEKKIQSGYASEDKSDGEWGDKDEWTGIMSTKGTSEVSDENSASRGYPSDDDEERLIEGAGWESGSIDDGSEGKVDSGDGVSLSPGPPRKKSETSRLKNDMELSENDLSSKFLPSLSMGYVKGNSDSDFDSEEENPIKERKNRRGQRARQAIWIKKYGKNAKHLKKERQTFATKSFEFAAKNGVGGKGRSFNRDHSKKSFESFHHKPAQAVGALHPSWEAKRILKSRETAQILSTQGKKIVFS